MLIPKKDRLLILRALFEEGTMCAKKDYNQPKHQVLDTKNLFVLGLMKSLVSKGLVKEQFSWQWYYWFLLDEGIEYLRTELHLPEEVIPKSLKQGATRRELPGDGDRRGGGDRREGGRGRGGFGGDRRGGRGGDKKFGAPAAGDIRFGGRGGSGGRGGGRGRDFN